MLLQRWEPTVSDHSPSVISFWITIHNIPLHYWKDVAMDAIGLELGVVEDKEATKTRVRVQINGLKLLEMKRDIHLPSGQIKEVEFKYEKLKKHYFRYKALTHEDDDCQLKISEAHRTTSSQELGISQRNTINKLEERKQEYRERQQASSALNEKPLVQ